MESISEFIEKYVSVSDIVTTLITMAIAGVFTLILRAIWKGIKKLSKDKQKTRNVLQYIVLFLCFEFPFGIGLFVGLNRDNALRVICWSIFAVYFAIRLSVLIKQLLDETANPGEDCFAGESECNDDRVSDE